MKFLLFILIMFVLDYLAGEKVKNFLRHGEVNSIVKGNFFFSWISLLVQIYVEDRNAQNMFDFMDWVELQ